MKNSLLISLILALVTPLACIDYDRSDGGHLIYDNRSDYSIQMRFYNIPDTFPNLFNTSLDSVIINLRPSSTWARRYNVGQGAIFALGLGGHPDSVVIIYNSRRITIDYDTTVIGQKILTLKDNSEFFSRQIIAVVSPRYQKETVWGGWFRNWVDEINYRYIFTNADYEFAKPIRDP